MFTRLVADIAAAERARVRRRAGRVAGALALLLLAAVAAVVGLVFVLLGAFHSLDALMQPWQAGAIVGGAAILLALVLLVVALCLARGGGRRRAAAAESPEETSATPAGRLGAAAGDALAGASVGPVEAALGALVVGLVFGAASRGRRGRSAGRRSDDDSSS